MKKYLYLTISILLLFSYYSILFMRSACNYYVRMEKENIELKKDISAMGGLGLDVTELEKVNAIELVNVYQEKHGLNKYEWRYEEIGYPVDPECSYITSEYGNRYINGKLENAQSIDIRQGNNLKVKASISGFCRVSYHKIYGNNIIIENYVVMKNALGEKQIHKVKIRFSHLSRVDVKNGQWIRKDEFIGLTGNSGRCAIYDNRLKIWREITEHERNLGFGVHLDFELEINGYKRNPVTNSTFKQLVRI